MSAAALQSEARSRAAAVALKGIRADGRVQATFRRIEGRTRVARLAERGGYRMLFPRPLSGRAEAVIVNTGGGVVGGDRIGFDVEAGPGADVVVTTQAAERIYRSAGPSSELRVQLQAGSEARLAWLPQETILFSGARLHRRIEVDVADDATVLLAESTVFGRIASGEDVRGGSLQDVWHVRRGGRLVFAEATRLDDVSKVTLARPAVLGQATAVALLLLVAPDAEARLTALRQTMHDARGEVGASAWNGMLVVRCAARAAQDMRRDVARAIPVLSGAALPRVWSN